MDEKYVPYSKRPIPYTNKSVKILFGFGVFCLFGAFVMLTELEIGAVALYLGLALLLLYLSKEKKEMYIRYDRYLRLIRIDKETDLNKIADKVHCPLEKVSKEIQNMISKRYIIDVYLDNVTHKLEIESAEDEIENQYKEKNQKRIIVAKCLGCGSQIEVEEGKTGKCEYCGSIIQ